MKKSIISLAVAAGLIASMPAQAGNDIKVKWFGYGQMTAQTLKQNDVKTPPTDGLTFGGDRIRIGYKLKAGNVYGKLQVDFNKDQATKKSGQLPEIIKDMEAGYKFSNAAKIKMGQYKTPVGMDFNTSGKKLDITKRGMEKKLVTERSMGVMLSGRKIANGFGYDVFYGNPATRGAASAKGKAGDAVSYSARVMYDMGKMMHAELSYGLDETSSTAANADDYSVIDLGLIYKGGPNTVKFEYITGTSVKGVKDADETVWFLHYGYMIGKTYEVMARFYQADQDRAAGSSASMTNTYLGVNFYLGSNKTNGRLQLNYVISGGDNQGSTDEYDGTARGYRDDAFLAQYQVSF